MVGMLEGFRKYLAEKLLGYTPIKTQMRELEENNTGLYVWLVEEEKDLEIVEDVINRIYIEEFGEEPKSTHVVLNDIKEINKYDKEQLVRVME